MNVKLYFSLVLVSFFSFFSFFSTYSQADSLACANDTTTINALFAQNMVPYTDQSVSSSTCPSRKRYLFRNVNLVTRACSPPTTFNNLPSGVVITGKDNFACTTGSIDGAYKIRAANNPDTVCLLSPIPDGYIVTSQGALFSDCPSDKAKTIRLPEAVDYMCQTGGDVPAGYIVTSVDNPSQCTGVRLRIERPIPGQIYTVCSISSVVPPGYVILSTDSYSQCSSNGSGPGYRIGPVTGSSANICISSADNIPFGYVVIDVPSISTMDCGFFTQVKVGIPSSSGITRAFQKAGEILPNGYVIIGRGGSGDGRWYDIKIPTGSTRICQGSSVPEGYAIFSQGSSSLCGEFSRVYYDINLISGDGPFRICSNHNVPSGYLITERKSSTVCSSGAYVIRKPNTVPGSETLICNSGQHVIPNGFVTVERDNYSICKAGIGSLSGVKITIPPNMLNTTICQGSPIPDGFVIKREESSSRCASSGSRPSLVIGPVEGSGPFQVCSTTIPTGFVIVSSTVSISCENPGISYRIILPSDSPAGICSLSPIPEDFVVVGKSTLGSCSTGGNYTIRRPSLSGNTVVCSIPNRAIPTGFVDAGFGARHYPTCDGNGVVIRPLAVNGSIVPAPFINSELDVLTAPPVPSVQCYSGVINIGLVGAAQKI